MDPELIANGVPFKYAGATWLLKPHSTAFELVVLQHLQQLGCKDLGDATPEQQGAATARGIADELLSGWTDIEDEEDEPLEFSPDAAFDLLRHAGCEDIRRQLVAASRMRSRYMDTHAALAAKN